MVAEKSVFLQLCKENHIQHLNKPFKKTSKDHPYDNAFVHENCTYIVSNFDVATFDLDKEVSDHAPIYFHIQLH